LSSHHFVREDQEPALIILDAEAVAFSRIQELLEWSPTVIVQESNLPMVLGWGIKIDVVIANANHKENLLMQLSDQGPLKFIWHNDTEDSLEMALHFLLASRQRYGNVIGHMTSELKVNLQTWSDRIKITWLEQTSRWNWITTRRLEKWLPQGSQYEVHDGNGMIVTFIVDQDQLVIIEKSEPFWLVEFS
jgi:hypothetical protein